MRLVDKYGVNATLKLTSVFESVNLMERSYQMIWGEQCNVRNVYPPVKECSYSASLLWWSIRFSFPQFADLLLRENANTQYTDSNFYLRVKPILLARHKYHRALFDLFRTKRWLHCAFGGALDSCWKSYLCYTLLRTPGKRALCLILCLKRCRLSKLVIHMILKRTYIAIDFDIPEDIRTDGDNMQSPEFNLYKKELLDAYNRLYKLPVEILKHIDLKKEIRGFCDLYSPHFLPNKIIKI